MLIEALAVENQPKGVRVCAIESLGNLTPSAADRIVPVLLVRLRDDEDSNIGQAIVEALRKLGPLRSVDMPLLLQVMKGKSVDARAFAMEEIGNLGKEATPVLGTIIETLGDSDPKLQGAAAKALGAMGPAAREALPALTPLLKSPDVAVKQRTVVAILKIGPDRPSVPLLIEAMKDKDASIAADAAKALARSKQLRPEDAPFLLEVLKNASAAVRVHAVMLLGETKADSKLVILALADGLRDDNKDVRLNVANTLAAIGPRAWYAAAALGNALKDKDLQVRIAAIAALERIGPDGSLGSASLVTALREPELRAAASKAFVRIGKAAVSPLVDTLENSRDGKEKVQLVDILGQIGPDAKAAIPALTRLSREDFATVRQAAREALQRIQQK